MSGESTQQREAGFPTAGGEMGALIRRFDWFSSPLGTPDGWSPALRMMVSFLLANRFPMLLWWGPDYICLYNDAYIPILGQKHPWALGRPVRECWSEIWDILQPLIDTPFRGGPATWSEDIELHINRIGFTEETHFTIAYSPVPDESAQGGIGGVLATVHEITEKVIGQRRVTFLRDLAARLAEAQSAEEACTIAARTFEHYPKDIPFALFYLNEEGSSGARLAACCGFGENGNFPGTVLAGELDDAVWPLKTAAATGRITFTNDLRGTMEHLPRGWWADPPKAAAVVPMPAHGPESFSGFLVAGLSPLLRLDEAYENFLELATGQVATAIASARAYEAERKRAAALQRQLQSRTEELETILDIVPVPVWISNDPDCLDMRGNRTAAELYNVPVTSNVSASALNPLPIRHFRNGREVAPSELTIQRAAKGEHVSNDELEVHLPDGRVIMIAGGAVPLRHPDGSVRGAVGAMMDVTARKRAEEALRESEERLTMAVEGAGMGTWDVNVRTGVSRWSKAHYELLGYMPEGVTAPTLDMWHSRVHAEDLSRVEAAIERAKTTREHYISEHRIVRADTGEIRWANELGQFLFDDSGQPYRFVGVSFDVTERKAAEERSRRSQATFTELVERAPFGMYIVDSQFRIALVNKASQQRVFRNVRPLIGRSFSEAMHILWSEPVADGMIAAFRHTLETGEPHYAPGFVNRRQDTQNVEAYEWELHRMEMPDGSYGVICYFYDSTDLRNAEAALQESESRFRNMADYAPVMVWVTEVDARCSFLSESWYEFTGQTEELGLGNGWLEAVHPEDRQRVETVFRQANIGREAFRVDYRLRRHDGVYRWCIDAAKPRLSPGGAFVGFIGSVLDITDSKEAEEALRHSEERLRLATQTGKVGIWDWDIEKDSVTWTDSLYQIHGVSKTEFGGTASAFAKLIHPEDGDGVKAAIERSLNEGAPYQLTMRAVRPDGRVVWLFTNAFVLRHQGRPVRMLGATLDITELKTVEQELLRANKDLEQFAYSASHDLQEPLRTVKIFSELLAKQFAPLLEGRGLEYLENVRAGATRMEVLIRDLLTYLRVTRLEKKAEPCDAGFALRAALENLGAAIAERRATVQATDLPVVPVSPTHLQQLFQNLVGNAIKYTAPGIAPMVQIAARRGNGQWVFSVADNGIGIAEEFQERIFGLFKRLHADKQYAGTGIGLALCQRIIERYDGRIWVESEPGVGSTFYFSIPA